MTSQRAPTAHAHAKQPRADERRRSERRPHVVEAWVASPTATDPDDRHEVTAVNVSRHGLAFVFDKPLPVASFYRIEVAIGAKKIDSEVRIISCRQVAEDEFEIGAEFC